jgi:hypothetical protein
MPFLPKPVVLEVLLHVGKLGINELCCKISHSSLRLTINLENVLDVDVSLFWNRKTGRTKNFCVISFINTCKSVLLVLEKSQ